MDQAQYWSGNPKEYQNISVGKFAESFHSYHSALKKTFASHLIRLAM